MNVALVPFDSSSPPLIHNDKEIFGNEISAVFSFPEWGYCGETLNSIDHLCNKKLIVQAFTSYFDIISFDAVIICDTYLQHNVENCITGVINTLLSSGVVVINLSSAFNHKWLESDYYKNRAFVNEKSSCDFFPSPACQKIAIAELSPSNNSHYVLFSLWNQLKQVNMKTAVVPSFRLISCTNDIHCFDWDIIKHKPINEYVNMLRSFMEKTNKYNYDIQLWELPKEFLEDGYSDILLDTNINVKEIQPDILVVILPSEIYDSELIEKLTKKIHNSLNVKTIKFVLGNNFHMFDAQQDYLPIYLSPDTFDYYQKDSNNGGIELISIFSCLDNCDFAKTLLNELIGRSESGFLSI